MTTPSIAKFSSVMRSQTAVEPLTRTQLQRLEHLFQKSTILKRQNWNAKNPPDTYISNIVTVQSLLNIRSTRERLPHSYDDRIVINICGDRYETYRSTLERYPNTLLGNARLRQHYFDANRNEYFFDRNRSCFESILSYYQSQGRLRRPSNIAVDIFLEEVVFFQLGEEALNQLRKDENIEEVPKVRLPKNRFRRYLWATMEYPDFSRLAKVVNLLSLVMILLSTITLAVQTLPQYVNSDDDLPCQLENNFNQTTENYLCSLFFSSPFFIIESVCVAFFTIEFFLRLISTPSLFAFVKNPMNWIDLFAFVPFYVTLGIGLTDRQNPIDTRTYAGLRLLRILRLVRALKFYRLFKMMKSSRVLISTVQRSIPDFLIMFLITSLLAFLFGSATYFAENNSNADSFDSIPKATYWAIMTITTVGYGDIAPQTPIGRVLACVCALFGSAITGILLSVLVGRYQRVYARKLYVKEEPIDFENHSEDEEIPTMQFTISTPETPNVTPNIASSHSIARAVEAIEVAPVSEEINHLYFILGYVINDQQIISEKLLEKLHSIVRKRQRMGHAFYFHRIGANEPTSKHVKFELASSEDEGEENDVPLTEIASGCRRKGNVLKTFQRRPSTASEQTTEAEHYL